MIINNILKTLSVILVLPAINMVFAKSDIIVNSTDELARLITIDEPVHLKKEVTEPSLEEKIAALKTDAKEFISKINNIQTMSAEFKQTEESLIISQQIDKNNKSPILTGKLDLAKPNKLRWEILSPVTDKQIYITDGNDFWHYDKGLEQVVLDKFDSKKIASSPFFFLLSNVDNIAEQYNVIKLGNNQFKLQPNIKANLASNYISDLQLEFINDSNSIKNITFVAAQNKKITISLNSVKVNPKLSNSDFKLSIPRGVDVIDASELY